MSPASSIVLYAFHHIYDTTFKHLNRYLPIDQDFEPVLWQTVKQLTCYDLRKNETCKEVVLLNANDIIRREAADPVIDYFMNTLCPAVNILLAVPSSELWEQPEHITTAFGPDFRRLLQGMSDEETTQTWNITLYYLLLFTRAALLLSGRRYFHAFYYSKELTSLDFIQVYDNQYQRTDTPPVLPFDQLLDIFFDERTLGIAYRWDVLSNILAYIGRYDYQQHNIIKLAKPVLITSPCQAFVTTP